jgi:hypothetical protein
MWNPEKEKCLIPGKLGEADISLYPLALHINRLAMENLRKSGKDPIVLGWHWLGSEQDTREGGYDNPKLLQIYDNFFDTMIEKADVVAKFVGIISVIIYFLSCIVLDFIGYSDDAYELVLVLQDIGYSGFMLTVVLFIANKLKKDK